MSDTIQRLNAALEGRYEVEREIGEGGMATVFLAKDLRHNRNVALKVLKPELAAVVGAAVPTPLDPVRVAPHIYGLEFENEQVRVIRQTIRNGETQPLHAHPTSFGEYRRRISSS